MRWIQAAASWLRAGSDDLLKESPTKHPGAACRQRVTNRAQSTGVSNLAPLSLNGTLTAPQDSQDNTVTPTSWEAGNASARSPNS
jgi:hypothetical protein